MDKLEDFIAAYDRLNRDFSDFVGKNPVDQALAERDDAKNKLAQAELALRNVQKELKEARLEGRRYKEAAQQQLFNEKARLLQRNKNRLMALVISQTQPNVDKLNHLERQVDASLTQLIALNNTNEQKTVAEVTEQLTQLKARIAGVRREMHDEADETKHELAEAVDETHTALTAEPISDEVFEREVKTSTIESNFGLRGLSYVGVFFVFLAVVTLGVILARAINQWLTPDVKGALLFLIPLAAFGFGEFLRRKRQPVLGLSLIGGAIGLYDIVVFINYFFMQVMSSWLAFALLVIGSALGIFIAVVYRVMPMAILATVGGYVPLVTYWSINGMTPVSLSVASAYVFLLSWFGISLYNRFAWRSELLLTFVLSVPWISVVTTSGIMPNWAAGAGLVIYLTMFAVRPVANVLHSQSNQAVQTWTWLGASWVATFNGQILAAMTNHVWMFVVMSGITTLVVFATYFLIKRDTISSATTAGTTISWVFFNLSLLYTISLTGLNMHWSAIGSILAAFFLVVFYMALATKSHGQLFYTISTYIHVVMLYILFILPANYLDRVIGFVLVLGLYTWLQISKATLPKIVFQIATVILFLHADVIQCLTALELPLRSVWITVLLFTIFVLAAGYWAPFKSLKLPEIQGSALALTLLVLNIWPFESDIEMTVALLTNLLWIVWLAKTGLAWQKRGIIGAVTVVITITGMSLIYLTELGYVNLRFAYLSLVFDVLYAAVAVAYIVFGLRKRWRLLRTLGLISLILVMAKTLLLDIATATLMQRFVAFLVFGLLSLTVSFLYQRALASLDSKNSDGDE
jgi:hypothetical protein